MATALDLRAEVRVDDALRELAADHAFAEREQVQVDVLHRVACRPFVVHDSRADPSDLVRRDRRSDARAAGEDAALDLAARDRVGEHADDHWIVVVRIRRRTVLLHLVAGFAQVLHERRLQRLTRVVCRDADLQATFVDASAVRISSVEIAPSRSTFTSCVVQSTIVDDRPPVVGPPSRTSEIRPSSCASTSCAVREYGWPDRFALVTGRPTPLAEWRRLASG